MSSTDVSPLTESQKSDCHIYQCTAHLTGSSGLEAHILAAHYFWSGSGLYVPNPRNEWQHWYTCNLPCRRQSRVLVECEAPDRGQARFAVIDFASRQDGLLRFRSWSMIVAMEVDGRWLPNLDTNWEIPVKVVF